MPTLNATSADDILVPSVNGTNYRGQAGDDTYIISKAINPNAKIKIIDTEGSNTIQLVDGLVIASSKFAANALELTLSNGAKVTINGSNNFTFEISGNATTGTVGTNKTFAELASIMGVGSLPTSGLKSGAENLTVSDNSFVEEGLPKLTWKVSVEGKPDYNIIDVSATEDKTVSGTNDDDDFRFEVTSAGVLLDMSHSIIIDNFDKDNDKITFIITDGFSKLTTQEFDSLVGVEVTSDALSGTQIFFAPDGNGQSGSLTIEGVEESFSSKWEANTYNVEIAPLDQLFVSTVSYYPITEGESVTVTIISDRVVLEDTIIQVYGGNSDDWSLSEPYNSEKQDDGSYASEVQVIMKAGTQEVSFQVLAKSDDIAEVTQKMNIKMYTLDDSFTWDLPGDTASTSISFKIFDQSSSSASPSYTLTKSSSSVDEGDEVTFTITASSAVTSDTQFSWSIKPDDNGNTVDKASSSDIDAESGTATIASGTTSTTFSIKALSDSEEEGIEGIKVSVLDSNSNSIGSEEILISNVTNDIKGTDGNDDLTLTKGDDDFAVTLGKDTIDGGEGEDTITVLRGTKIIKSQDVFGTITGTKGKVYLQIQLEGETNWTYAYNFEKIQVKGEDTLTLVDEYYSKSRWDVSSNKIDNFVISNNASQEIDLSDSFYTLNADTTMNYSIDFSNDKVSDQIILSGSTLSFKGGSGGDTYTVTITARGTQKFSDNFNFSTSDFNYDDQTFTVTLSDDDYIEGQTGTSSDDNITLTSGDDTYEYTTGTDKIDGGAGSDTFVVNSEDVSIVRAIDVRGEDAYTGLEGKEFLYIIPKTGSGYTIATNFENIQYNGVKSSLDNFTSYNYVDVSSWRNDTEGVKIQDQSIENNESKTIDLDKNFFTINKGASLSYSLDFSNDKVSDQISISGSNLSIQGGVGGDKYEVEVTVRATQVFSDGTTLSDDFTYEEDTFTITLSDDDYVAVNASNNTTPSTSSSLTQISVTEDIIGGVLINLTPLNIDEGTIEIKSWGINNNYNVSQFDKYFYLDEEVLKLKDGVIFNTDRTALKNLEIGDWYNNATSGEFDIVFDYESNGTNKRHTLKITEFIDTIYGSGIYGDGNYHSIYFEDYAYPSENNLKSLILDTKWINTSSNSSDIVEVFYSFVSKDSNNIRISSNKDSGYSPSDPDDTLLDPPEGFKAAVYEILVDTASIFKLKFTELTGDDVDRSNIRFVFWETADTNNSLSGYAWPPDNQASFVFILKPPNFDDDFSAGKFIYGTIRHEIGHALGLAHPHEDNKIDSVYNSSLYTIMAYESVYDSNIYDPYDNDEGSLIIDRSTNEAIDVQTWQMFDIKALKYLYGLRSDYNSGDNTYTFTSEVTVKTIHDMGGYDTIDLSGSSTDNDIKFGQINLGGGAIFQAGAIRMTWKGDDYQTGQVFTTSFDTEIEKFIGSDGIDNVILGPTSDTILTNGGDDLIYSIGAYKSPTSIKIDAGSGSDSVNVFIETSEVNALLDINGGSDYDFLKIYNGEEEIDLTIYMQHFDNFENFRFINSTTQTITIDVDDFIEFSDGSILGIVVGDEDTIILPEGAEEDTSKDNDFYDYYVLNDITIAISDNALIG